jgi:cell division protein FtsB
VVRSLNGWAPTAELLRFSRIFEQKFLSRERLRHIVLAVVAVWVLWTFMIGDAGVPRILWVRHENAKLREKIGELSVVETELKAEVKALRDGKDLKAFEKVAREEHALVKDGEKLVRFYRVEDE